MAEEETTPTATDAPEAPPKRDDAARRRGFAAMDPERQREIARRGGRASGGRPENLRAVDRREAGRRGGHAVVEKYGHDHMAEIGRQGGKASGGRPENLEGVDRSAAGKKGGEAVLEKYGPSHMAEIGRRGGVARGKHAKEAMAGHTPPQETPASEAGTPETPEEQEAGQTGT
jgi:hypothetical protein